ncbi:hypothetical protein ACFXG4_04135 [Nocardia sp. NPDC059246]|uniref:hypothetical protein n=1 Tax=unclassified Nocardia TaxID=2637762 RepID=UPI0036C51BC5
MNDAVMQFHYLITLQWTAPNGSTNVYTETGITPGGRTREQMYLTIFNRVTAQHGAPPARTSILFFSLEPNNLTGDNAGASAA